ncbi:MAG: YceI family protein [Vicinamibacteria bacterium]
MPSFVPRIRRSLLPAWLLTSLAVVVPPTFAEAPVAYSVVPAKSSIRIHVGKSGPFAFAGHKHEVIAPVSGMVTADASKLAASHVELTFLSQALSVSTEGEPEGDAAKVQDVMRGPKVLDAVAFPEIHFKTKTVSGQMTTAGHYDLTLVGEISLHGLSQDFSVPVKVVIDGTKLTASGRLTLRQDQFGITPVTVAGGAVKVKNEVEIDFDIVAERR